MMSSAGALAFAGAGSLLNPACMVAQALLGTCASSRHAPYSTATLALEIRQQAQQSCRALLKTHFNRAKACYE
jgi:hypothetical protein